MRSIFGASLNENQTWLVWFWLQVDENLPTSIQMLFTRSSTNVMIVNVPPILTMGISHA